MTLTAYRVSLGNLPGQSGLDLGKLLIIALNKYIKKYFKNLLNPSCYDFLDTIALFNIHNCLVCSRLV